MPEHEPKAAEITDAFIAAVRKTLTEGMRKIEHCAAQLTDAQIWHRPRPEMNSIANLMLHLSGNLRQWIVSGVGGAKDIRNRPMEFSDRSNRPKHEVLAILKQTVSEADIALSAVTPAALLSCRQIQSYDVKVIEAIEHTIPHFRGHVQEIIHMTRQQLASSIGLISSPKEKLRNRQATR